MAAEEHRDDTGRAWIAWIHDGYAASLQGGAADPTIYEQGIGPAQDDGLSAVTLTEALSWALPEPNGSLCDPDGTRKFTTGPATDPCLTSRNLSRMRFPCCCSMTPSNRAEVPIAGCPPWRSTGQHLRSKGPA